jgi:regulator of PEP synthase PpsR (kinase-PPPase family)
VALTIYVVSDSLGETAEQVVRGAAIQFNGGDPSFDIVRMGHVTDEAAIRRAVESAKRRTALIVFTLVRPELRAYMASLAEGEGIPAVDLLGPVLDALHLALGREPQGVPGLVHRLDRDYFERVEAVEFAVRYDDGKDTAGVAEADVVVLGVSRTSKTPVSLYLANHRLKVANIPLVPEVPVPREVLGAARRKCVGLIIDPDLLMPIRRQRLRTLGLSSSAQYASRERIQQELEYAWQVYQEVGCPVIDVSNHAVEETASKILELFQGEERS